MVVLRLSAPFTLAPLCFPHRGAHLCEPDYMLILSTPVIFASSTTGKDGRELRQYRRFTRGIHSSTHAPLYVKVRVTFRLSVSNWSTRQIVELF